MARGHRVPPRAHRLIALVIAAAASGACGGAQSSAPSAPPTTAEEVLHPDIVAADATRADDGTWRFDVTVSSPYDTPARYADAWRVLAPDGTELGVRILAHDHAGEQPFTRSLAGVVIPDDVLTVTIEGRDQVSGWGGTTVDVDLG